MSTHFIYVWSILWDKMSQSWISKTLIDRKLKVLEEKNMELQIIPRKEEIPVMDTQSIKIKHIAYYPTRDGEYEEEQITEDLISKILSQIPKKINVTLSLIPYGEDDWLEVICDGNWLALGYCSDGGSDNYYMVIPFEQLDENQAWQTPVDQTGHHQNYGG